MRRALVDDSPPASEEASAISCALLVLGLLSLRSGSGPDSAGDAGADLRFLDPGLAITFVSFSCSSFALSKAFQARSSSCDSGGGGARSRRVVAVSLNLAAPPNLSAIWKRRCHCAKSRR